MWWRKRREPASRAEMTVLLTRVGAALDRHAVVYAELEELIRRREGPGHA